MPHRGRAVPVTQSLVPAPIPLARKFWPLTVPVELTPPVLFTVGGLRPVVPDEVSKIAPPQGTLPTFSVLGVMR